MDLDSTPLISCIMPTNGRRRFVGQAIWYYMRQDYPNRELIIVDDGDDAVADLVPDDGHIRYFRHDEQLSLGAKRNLANELSQGQFIAHWDDDDWYASNRLSVQLAGLLSSSAKVCGSQTLLYYQIEAGKAWRYQYSANGRPWLAGCTLLYDREAWHEHPFPDITVGEDSAFVGYFSPEYVYTLNDQTLFVGLIHSQNTGAKNLLDARWEQRPLSEVSQLLALDRPFYAELRNGRRLAGPPDVAKTTVTLAADFNVYSGYGSMAEYLALSMTRAGASVNAIPLSLDRNGLSDEFMQLVSSAQPRSGAPTLYFSWPKPALNRFLGNGSLFINTMYESSRLPATWVEQLNRTKAVIVPSRFVERACRDSGVNVPVEVVPEGVDPDVYHYIERPERPGLTTLIVGPMDDRKNLLQAIAAWKEAFDNDEEARLIIKTQYLHRNFTPNDHRIRYVEKVEPTRGIGHWYAQADVLLALGNEGFGLPLVEGMATGLPVIALDAEGQADICADAPQYVLPVKAAGMTPHNSALSGRSGFRSLPDVAQAAAHLRWVRRHRQEARAMGRAASEWVLRRRDIWAKGPAVLDIMERSLQLSRPLRRLPTFWTPSMGTTCGIAEYTAHLVAALPAGRVTKDPPELAGIRLLHVQHEPSLFQERALLWQMERARGSRVPVVVTEHATENHARAWESHADALVSLTGEGAARLQQRWPDKLVEHIPPGCFTWFPPRKKKRGRVIGSFGFLGLHKGFWRLLDVLRSHPSDTELLLFSHARHPQLAAQWEQQAGGLPVKRIDQYLPVEEIARQLAARADILVFWYDEVPQASASYAVRIGLATGVPVLASPTSWFNELRAETYQSERLEAGIERLLEDTALRRRLTAAAREYCEAHSWSQIAARHKALWNSLMN